MAVARDANGTFAEFNAVTSGNYTNLTVGAALTHSALIAQIGYGNTAVSITKCAWDNTGTPQPLTIINRAVATDSCGAELWGLIAPTAGAKTLRVEWDASTDFIMNATSYKGVDPTGGDTSFKTKGLAYATSTSVRLTIAAGATTDKSIACAQAGNGGGLTAPLQTELFNDVGAGSSNPAASEAAGSASSVTHGWTTSSAPWAIVGCAIFNDLHPYITLQPVSVTVVKGQTANFSITATASSGSLTYQWKKNGSNDGSNSTSYSIGPTVNSDDLTTVRCDVTDTNGTTQSNQVYLRVIPAAEEDWYKA